MTSITSVEGAGHLPGSTYRGTVGHAAPGSRRAGLMRLHRRRTDRPPARDTHNRRTGSQRRARRSTRPTSTAQPSSQAAPRGSSYPAQNKTPAAAAARLGAARGSDRRAGGISDHQSTHSLAPDGGLRLVAGIVADRLRNPTELQHRRASRHRSAPAARQRPRGAGGGGVLLSRLPPAEDACPTGPRTTGRSCRAVAAYHLWTPWLTPTRLLAILPLSIIALRTGDIRIGIATHVLLNSVDLVIVAAYLLSR